MGDKRTTVTSKYGKEYTYVYSSQQEKYEMFTSDRIEYPQLEISEEDKLRIYDLELPEHVFSIKRYEFYTNSLINESLQNVMLNSAYPSYQKAVQQLFNNLDNL